MATKFDAVAGSELRDIQGEILDVKGADISELEAGQGIVNDNHSNKLPDVIGRVTGAKKIFKVEDCESDRQKYFWNKIKAPYIYVTGELFDDEDHRSARAAAAILRHQHKTDSPLKLKCSVEGGIVERGEKDDRILKRTKIKGLALTFTPANNATLVEGVDLNKSNNPQEFELIKSISHLARKDVPSFIEMADTLSEIKILSNVEKIKETILTLKKNNINKALVAGYGSAGSPTSLTGGGVFQTESIDTKSNKNQYIECPSCGKEQPYVVYQVKCRSCNKHFPFDTLAKFFINK